MKREDVKAFFGSLSELARINGIEPQAVSQWFDKDGNLIETGVRKNAILGSALVIGKRPPKSWSKAA